LFSKKDLPKSAGPAPLKDRETAVRELTLLERLKLQRATKETQFAVLNQELIELDAHIAGLERAKAFFPQIERLIEWLR
jgi:hypothetical protein